MPELPYLFVYGTLRRATGSECSMSLMAKSRFVDTARTRGGLFHLGRYPGMTVATDDHMWVIGEVYHLNDPFSTLPFLDEYEGCGPGGPLPHEFERQAVTVLLDSGRAIEAWAYIYCLETQGKPRITSGDYLQAWPA